MIAGDFSAGRSAYILNVTMDKEDKTKINSVRYTNLANIPFEFHLGIYQSCQGRIVLGTGWSSNIVAELDEIDWMEDIPSLNVQRSEAASVYLSDSKTLIVAGGSNSSNNHCFVTIY